MGSNNENDVEIKGLVYCRQASKVNDTQGRKTECCVETLYQFYLMLLFQGSGTQGSEIIFLRGLIDCD